MDLYWVGGTATWNATAGSKWATTSGGAGGAPVPTDDDNVFIDANSGAVTITASSAVCNNLDFTGFTGTLTISSTTLGIANGLVFSPTMTITETAHYLYLWSNEGAITSNGLTLHCALYIDGSVTLNDDLVTTQELVLGEGSFNANNKNVTIANMNTASSSSVGTLYMGSGLWTLTYASATLPVWQLHPIKVVYPSNATIKITNTTNTTVIFDGASKTYFNIWFARGASTGNIKIIGSNTFNDFRDTGTSAHSILFTAGSTQTVTSFTVSGSAGNLITITSTTTGTHALVKNGEREVVCDYLDIKHSVVTPANKWYAGLNSTDEQSTATAGSGWTFTTGPALARNSFTKSALPANSFSKGVLPANSFTKETLSTNSFSKETLSTNSFTKEALN